MKKKIFVLFCLVLLVLGSASNLLADVTGSGTYTPIIPGATFNSYGYSTSYNDANGNLINVSNYYGDIAEYPQYLGSSIAFGMTYNNPTYSGSGTFNGSSVTGTYDLSTGVQTISFAAVSHGPASEVRAGTDLIGSTSYFGLLNGNIGYNYFFTGQKDAAHPNDQLNFIIQMEIYWEEQDPTNPNRTLVHHAYSDYGDATLLDGGGYRNNWAYFYDTGTGIYSGEIRFNYPQFGEHNWFIRWDFMGSGFDTTPGTSTPIPEPATMLLIGSGLIGLAGLRKKFKK